jgi:hypothetical protein
MLEHWMMFSTFKEKGYFTYPEDDVYDGVILNANMVAYYSSGMASFIMEYTGALTSYLIDPMTHAFQHDPSAVTDEEGKPKASLKKLAEYYGYPFRDVLGERALQPSDLEGSNELEWIAERCVRFQTDVLADQSEESEYSKYIEFDGGLEPRGVVAPYFFLSESRFSEWWQVNQALIDAVIDIEFSVPTNVWGALVLSKSVLTDEDKRQEIISSVSDRDGLSGVLVWVDDLPESSSGQELLTALNKILVGLEEKTDIDRVLNLHGGYFSIASGNPGIRGGFGGVTHGPEFGESRSVTPVGGGLPVPKFYVPDLHTRVRFRTALTIFRNAGWLDDKQAFFSNVCDCRECKRMLKGSEGANGFEKYGETEFTTFQRQGSTVRMSYPTEDAKERCLRHYLHCKQREFQKSREKKSEDLINDLRETADRYMGMAGDEVVEHLVIWSDVLSNFRRKRRKI